MSDYELPELPSDEELGIAGMDPEEEGEKGDDDRKASPPPGPTPPGGSGGGPKKKSAPEPAPPRGPRWRGPVTLLILVVLAWLASPARSLPDPRPATAPDTAFSSARAMVRVVELARAAHPPGSPEHRRVREWIVDALAELGLEPEVRTTTSWVRRGSTLRGATVRNIVARVPGADPSGAVLLTAHYDGRTLSPAAGDDASGVAAILEAVRAVRAGDPLRNDLIVLFTDGEELGLLGARAFVRDDPRMADVSVVLSLEMRGGGGPSIMFETGSDNGWIVEALAAGDPAPMANSMSMEIYRRMPNDTDFTPFAEAGIQGLNFAGIGRARVYHQTFDTPANLQEATVQHHGVHLLGMVRELGGRDLTEVDAPDRVYFSLPFVGLIHYGSLWVPVLGFVLLLGAVGVALWGRRRGVGAGSVVAGLLLALLSTAAAAGAGWALFGQLRARHPEYGLLQGSAFHSEGWYVLALVAGAFALVTGLLGLARRRASLPGLATGALLPVLLAALFATFVTPAAAMNLQWPVLAALLGVAVVTGVAGPRRPGLVGWVLLLALAAPVLAFTVPVTEQVWHAMSLSLAPVLAGLAVLSLLLLLPLLDTLGDPNRWWAPVTGLLLAGLFLGVGLLRARPTADRPTPSTLAYVLDRESGEARWVSRDGPGLSWARERAGALETLDTLDSFLVGDRPVWTGPAPVAPIPPPAAAVAGDSALARTGTTRVALRSGSGAEMMTVAAAPGSRVVWRAAGGQAVQGGGAVTSVVHWGTPENALLLDLEAPAGADSVRLVVVEHHLRPAELVGEEPFRRPPDLVPAVDWISDRALVRTLVTLPVGPGPGLPRAGGAGARTDSAASDSASVGPTPGSATASDPLGPDTVAPGAPPDSAATDTLPSGGVPPDTTGTDTLPPGGVDTLSPAAVPLEPTRSDARAALATPAVAAGGA